MGSPLEIVVDTDCGVDDAMALLLAFGSEKRARVVGITCVFGNTALDNVCNNVKRVLVLCNRKEVAIYRGCSGPLIRRKIKQDTAYHAEDGLGGVAQEYPTGDLAESEVPAAMALIQLTQERPGEITLVALGPLTNLALAHRIDPQFTQRLKSLVIMGGNCRGIGNTTELAEFNFHQDPESADIVLGEALCPVQLVPWETCHQFGYTEETHDRRIQIPTPRGQFFRKTTALLIHRVKTRARKLCTDCDLLAVAAALYPEAVRSVVAAPLSVECGGSYSRGLTVLLNHYNSSPHHGRRDVQIVTGFDGEFLDNLRFLMLQDQPIDL